MSTRNHRRDVAPIGRSKVTNGRRVLPPGSDLRTETGRRYADVHNQIIADLATRAGSVQSISSSARHMARHLSALIVWAEGQASSLTTGDEFDAATYARVVGLIDRVMSKLGLDGDAMATADSDADFARRIRSNPLVHPGLLDGLEAP